MAVTTEEIREKYRHLDDQRVVDIAVGEVYELRPVAVEVLHTEISRRGLPPILHEAVDLQALDHSDPRFRALLESFRQSACPVCGGDQVLLNACRLPDSKAAGAVAAGASVLVAGCPSCLEEEIQRSQNRQIIGVGCGTLLSGFLALPFAILNALGSSSGVGQTLSKLRSYQETEELREYVSRVAGRILVAKSSGS